MPQPRSVGRLSASTFSLKLLAYITLCIVRVTSKPHGEFKSVFFFLHSVLLPCHQRRFLLLTELQISITSHKRVPVIFLISIKMTLQDQGFTETPKGWVHKLLFKKTKNKKTLQLMTLKNFNESLLWNQHHPAVYSRWGFMHHLSSWTCWFCPCKAGISPHRDSCIVPVLLICL